MVLGSLICPPRVVDVQGRIVDISEIGLGIRNIGQPLEPGTVLCIRVPLSIKSKFSTRITIPVLAEVRWVRKVATKVREFGVRFMV